MNENASLVVFVVVEPRLLPSSCKMLAHWLVILDYRYACTLVGLKPPVQLSSLSGDTTPRTNATRNGSPKVSDTTIIRPGEPAKLRAKGRACWADHTLIILFLCPSILVTAGRLRNTLLGCSDGPHHQTLPKAWKGPAAAVPVALRVC